MARSGGVIRGRRRPARGRRNQRPARLTSELSPSWGAPPPIGVPQSPKSRRTGDLARRFFVSLHKPPWGPIRSVNSNSARGLFIVRAKKERCNYHSPIAVGVRGPLGLPCNR